MIGLDTIKLGQDFDYTYLSLGAGVQSSALLVLSCTDDRIPKPDVAIFADTGDEPEYVMTYLDTLKEYGRGYGVDVVTAQKGILSEYSLKPDSFVPVPLYLKHHDGSDGLLRRQCTLHYKINPINQKVRQLLGYKPRQRMKHTVRAMLGISTDEMQRMKESRTKWVTNCWPLIDLGIARKDCYGIVEKAGLPRPEKSACVYCPYRSDQDWANMKKSNPQDFAKAVEFDNAIRDKTVEGMGKQSFIHRSLVPLQDANFDAADPNQVDLFNNECEGMCGV